MAIYFAEQCHSRERRSGGKASQVTQKNPLFRLDTTDVTQVRRYLRHKDPDSPKGHFEVDLILPQPTMGSRESTPFMVFPLYTGLRKRAFEWLFKTKNRLLEKRHKLTHRPARSNDQDLVADPAKAVTIPKERWGPKRNKRVTDIDRKLEIIRSRTNDLAQISPQGQIILTVPCANGNAMIQFKKPPKKRKS